MGKIIRYFKRKRTLVNSRHFYRSMNGNFVHPHLMAVVTPQELYNMSDEDFSIISQ